MREEAPNGGDAAGTRRDQQDLSRRQGPRRCQPARVPRRGIRPDRRERRRQIDADARTGRRDRAERRRDPHRRQGPRPDDRERGDAGRHCLRAPGTEPVRESRRRGQRLYRARKAYWRAAEAGGRRGDARPRDAAAGAARRRFQARHANRKPVHRGASDGGDRQGALDRRPRDHHGRADLQPDNFGDRTAAGGDCRPDGAWHLGDLYLSPAGRDHDLR